MPVFILIYAYSCTYTTPILCLFTGAAQRLDSLRSSHPIIVPIRHAEEVEQVLHCTAYISHILYCVCFYNLYYSLYVYFMLPLNVFYIIFHVYAVYLIYICTIPTLIYPYIYTYMLQVFDAISYCKGSTVVNMVQAIVGKQNFQLGLQHYMSKHAYNNTETSDLWSAWSSVSGLDIGK